jgi:phospholipid transport system substrate-binding protein
MPRLLRLAALTAATLFILPAAADPAQAVQRPVQTLVQSVRYERDALALRQLDGEAQARALLGEAWEAASAEERAEFVRLFHGLFAAIAFPQVRDNFEHLETILYDAPEVDGEKASLTSTIVILHPLRKRELRVRYDLVRSGEGWRVVDAHVLGTGGESMLTEIRTEQIVPILADGGMTLLLELMRTRLEQVQARGR